MASSSDTSWVRMSPSRNLLYVPRHADRQRLVDCLDLAATSITTDVGDECPAQTFGEIILLREDDFPRWSLAEQRGSRTSKRSVIAGCPKRSDEYAKQLTSHIFALYTTEISKQSNAELCRIGIEAAEQIIKGCGVEAAILHAHWCSWQQELFAEQMLTVHWCARCGDSFSHELRALRQDLCFNRMKATDVLTTHLEQLLSVERQHGRSKAIEQALKMKERLHNVISELRDSVAKLNAEKEDITNIILEWVEAINVLFRNRSAELFPALEKLDKKQKRRHIGVGIAKAISTIGSITAVPLLCSPLVGVGAACALSSYGTNALTNIGDCAMKWLQNYRVDEAIERDRKLVDQVLEVSGRFECAVQPYVCRGERESDVPSIGKWCSAPRASCIIAFSSMHASVTAFAGLTGVGAAVSMADLVQYVSSGKGDRAHTQELLRGFQAESEEFESIRNLLSTPRPMIDSIRLRRSIDIESHRYRGKH